MIVSYYLNPDPKETWYWDSSNVTDMLMSGVKCTGSEMSLSQCQHHKTVSCQKSAAKFAAGVICSESEWWQKQMFKQAAPFTDDLKEDGKKWTSNINFWGKSFISFPLWHFGLMQLSVVVLAFVKGLVISCYWCASVELGFMSFKYSGSASSDRQNTSKLRVDLTTCVHQKQLQSDKT